MQRNFLHKWTIQLHLCSEFQSIFVVEFIAPSTRYSSRTALSASPASCASSARLRPYTLHPTPYAYTIYPTPYTLHPTPCTLHPAPYTPHPAPYTLHPAPCTLYPAPCALHHTPKAIGDHSFGIAGLMCLIGQVRLSTQCGTKSSSSISLMRTTSRWIPASVSTNQGPEKGDLIPVCI